MKLLYVFFRKSDEGRAPVIRPSPTKIPPIQYQTTFEPTQKNKEVPPIPPTKTTPSKFYLKIKTSYCLLRSACDKLSDLFLFTIVFNNRKTLGFNDDR